MKIYLKIVLLIGLLIFSLGFLLPLLFSAKSTLAVMAGGLYVVALIRFLFSFGKSLFVETKNTKTNK